MVDPTPALYRVVGTDQVVPESKTMRCTYCSGAGGGTGWSCNPCGGSGRVLRDDPYRWPVPVELIEDEGAEDVRVGGECGQHYLQPHAPRPLPANTAPEK